MQRSYSTGIAKDVTYFIGYEVEKTPAFGMKTLFVTGLQPIEEIKEQLRYKEINHIFFGANHSYNHDPLDHDTFSKWDLMIIHFLELGYMCTLDIPLSLVEEFNDGGLNEYDNFIPQIRIPIPYIKLWNYNTMLKIDDKGFNESNPGVWCHSLHYLMDRSVFTPWPDYNNDQIIK